ncbi:UNVERIFIED_CONTAM: Histone deacetylase 15 [Sesamum radiatum]|uniref:histone deacetylase n=1 Tax=Sesamum radiatum TaxID=300843 RepID=A0AAW2VTD5_SESRA
MVMVVLVSGWCGDDGAKFCILKRNYSAVVAIAKVQRWNCWGLILMVLMIVDVVAGGAAAALAAAQQVISCGQFLVNLIKGLTFRASEFDPDFTIISAGFDAARGDPLGCCDVTPTGYAQMTHMCSALSGGKLLVILEGGYNLRSISSSATAVIKVLGPINAYRECNEWSSFVLCKAVESHLDMLTIWFPHLT